MIGAYIKRYGAGILCLTLSLTLAACSAAGASASSSQAQSPASAASEQPTAPESASPASEAASSAPESAPAQEPAGSRVLVAYFSATGNTEAVAKLIADSTGAELFEIEPAVPYTADDLNYGNSGSRTSVEQNDAAARPEIANAPENPEAYDVIFLGYPIWWGQSPKIIYTFLESLDLSGKTIVPFCTSGSSGIGSSAENLRASADNAAWLAGQRFSGGATGAEIESWLDGLDIELTINE